MSLDLGSNLSRSARTTGLVATQALGPKETISDREEAVTNFIYTQEWNYVQSRSPLLDKSRAQAYIQELETKTRYQDLVDLFHQDTLKKLFGEPVNPKLLFSMVRDLFLVPNVNNPSAEVFFNQRIDALRDISDIAVKDKNFMLLNILPQVIIMGNYDEETFTRAQQIKLWKELQYLISSGQESYNLPGLVRMQLMANLLENYNISNNFITIVDQLYSDPELLEDIFGSAYREDPEKAQQIYKELFEVLDSVELNELYYTEQISRYFKVINAMKQINSESRRVPQSSNKNTAASTIEILEVRPNTTFTDQAPSQANTTELITQSIASLERFLEEPTTNQRRNKKAEINTNKYTPANKDIAAGLSVMIGALPESSPLRERLEDFLANMPSYVIQLRSPEIKAELLTILKPIFQYTVHHTPDLVNFFGTELSNLEQAYEAVLKKLSEHKELTALAKKMPKLNGDFDPKNYVNESATLGCQLELYEKEESTFKQFAKHLGRYQFSMQGIPVHEYVKKVLNEYEKLIQTSDPDFHLNLEASNDYAERVKAFNEFLVDVFIREPERSSAIQYLRNLCNDYMDGRLNDQTFMTEVKNIQHRCYEPDGAGTQVASDIAYLINKFVKQNVQDI